MRLPATFGGIFVILYVNWLVIFFYFSPSSCKEKDRDREVI
jgi:hypothetical protein